MSDRIDRISRADLYVAVWNQPVTAVAMRLGVSDQAVRKACTTMRIPLPPRGYWARIAAGQSVTRPELPPPRHGEAVEYRVVRARPTRQSDDTSLPQTVQITAIAVKPNLRNAHALARQCLDVARLHAKKVFNLPSPLTLKVSPHSQDQALRILDAIFRTLEGAGCQIFAAETYRDYPYAIVRGERISFRLARKAHSRRACPYCARAPVPLARANARSSAQRPARAVLWHGATPRYFVDRVWRETKTRSLQDCIKEICESFFAIVEKEITRRAAEAAEELRREERRKIQEQQRELARKKAEAAAHELARKISLRENAKYWHEARVLRIHIAAVGRAVRDRKITALSGVTTDEWLEWARSVAAELDPLNAIGARLANVA